MIDLRSDTVTQPTQIMRDAMRDADLGDDVYGDDPTVIALERRGADIMGHEAALFVPSGTFGNQLALFVHCERGDEVILGEDCHVVAHEAGGAAVIAGVQLRTVAFADQIPSAAAIKARVRTGDDIHEPKTGLICLENALANGRVVPLDTMAEIYKMAKNLGIPVHLDGARVFNAATALDVPVREIAACTDSVMLCLSKGLCAPVGSLLTGGADFIAKARRKRKLLGGGMRQAGVLAAPGLIALDVMTNRLDEDHANARLLENLLADIRGITLIPGSSTNLVFFRVDNPRAGDLQAELKKERILINDADNGVFRMVTHYNIKESDLRHCADVVRRVLG